MTIIDTSDLLDVLVAGATHGDESQTRMEAALRAGRLAVNDIIAAELAPTFAAEDDLWATLSEAQITLAPYPRAAVYLAGQAFRRYRRRGGARQRILPDFMIGAHAVAAGAAILTRDRGFYRDYFPGVRLA